LHTGSFQLDFAARLSFRAFLVIEQLEPPVLGPLKRRRVLGLPSPGIWWYRQRFAGWLRSLGPHRVVCISEAVRLALENDYGFARTRTTIIHNGVDVDRFHPSLREAARRTLGLDDDATVVATACRLVPQKGVDVAIQSLARVVAQSPSSPARLLVAGEGPERPALERLVDELGLSKRVRFMGFTGDTALFIPAADVFLVPSRIEAQGIVLLEALASGCDVIASRVGGVPEVARPPDVGTLVTADDADALAEALAAALRRTTPQRATRAKAARQHVEELFDARRQCGRIIDLMEELAR
jgi:glycosyltransferase involved in cell wall biosynthesis